MMRRDFLKAASAGILGAGLCGAGPASAAGSIFDANKRLGRGINLGNALDAPSEGAWGVTLQPEYFAAIKSAGFESVRLPTKWSAHAGRSAPYKIDKAFAERVDWAVEQATSRGLNIVVNVHHYDEIHDDPAAHLPRLIGLWSQIADRSKDRPTSVSFELLNEPHGKLKDAEWNAMLPRLLEVVRKTNPDRPVIIGPANWNGVHGIDRLVLPSGDSNLIATVHSYEPFHFTHQGAEWSEGSDKWLGMKWTGSEAEASAIAKTFRKAADWSKAHNVPIYLGEFGAYRKADMDSRVRWTRFIAREAERLGWSWAYWEFCSGFGAYDPAAKAWREPLKKALVE